MRPVEGPCGPRQRSSKGPLRYSETVSTPSSRTQVLDQLDLVGLILARETARSPRRPGRRGARTARRPRCARASPPRSAPGRRGRAARPRGTRSRSRSRPRSAGRSRPSSPATARRTASAITWAASWRITSRAPSDFAVGEDLDRLAVGERRREVAHLAVDAHRERAPSPAPGRSPRRRRRRSRPRRARGRSRREASRSDRPCATILRMRKAVLAETEDGRALAPLRAPGQCARSSAIGSMPPSSRGARP